MKTGKEVWDVEMADYKVGHAATVAPLVVKDKVIVGIAGGEYAIRGFLDAYDPQTGKRVWRSGRFPRRANRAARRGRPRAGSAAAAPTWVTGTYDPELNLIYWGTGNPNPDLDGDRPQGRQPLQRIARSRSTPTPAR